VVNQAAKSPAGQVVLHQLAKIDARRFAREGVLLVLLSLVSRILFQRWRLGRLTKRDAFILYLVTRLWKVSPGALQEEAHRLRLEAVGAEVTALEKYVSSGYHLRWAAQGSLHYAEAGDPAGPAVILLSPVGCAQWAPMMQILAKHCRVLAVDLPGFGGLSTVDSLQSDADALIDAVCKGIATVCEHAGVEQAVVVGSGIAGYFATFFAARHPTLARRVILVNPRGISEQLPLVPSGFVHFCDASFFSYIALQVPGVMTLLRSAYGQLVKARGKDLKDGSPLADTVLLDAAALAAVANGHRRPARALLTYQMHEMPFKAIFSKPLLTSSGELQADVATLAPGSMLLLCGNEDPVARQDFPALGKIMEQDNKGTVVALRGLGPSPHLEDPKAVAAEVLRQLPGFNSNPTPTSASAGVGVAVPQAPRTLG